jgi:BirA family biotin operon repressor/biotin-[acetyl-CoA-carboxylase] ligase
LAGTPERLAQLLRSSGTDWAGPIEHLEVVSSTNDELKLRCRAGAPEWSVLLADRQTHGRGRQGRPWASPLGNLYLSLPLAAGLAVLEAVTAEGVRAELKWPNDVLVRGRKLAGILVETTSGLGGLENAVVGVGVNVGVVPAEIAGATSFAAETGRAGDAVALAARVLTRLSVCYHALARDGPTAILPRWREGAAGWLGRPVEVQAAGGMLRGLMRGIDERGAMLLEEPSGHVLHILSGEAHEVRLGEP